MSRLGPSGARVILWMIVVLVVVIGGLAVDAPRLSRGALERLRTLGPEGPVIFVLVYVVWTVLLLPGSILTLGAGAIFGVLKGALTCWIAATAGATAAFLVARYLARDAVARWLRTSPRFGAIDEAVGREGWKIVGLARLTPVLPFNVLNYAFGITRVSLRDYVLASGIGMLPGAVMYAYLGSLAGDLATLGRDVHGPLGWAVHVVGVLATVAVTLYVARLARGALGRRVSA